MEAVALVTDVVISEVEMVDICKGVENEGNRAITQTED